MGHFATTERIVKKQRVKKALPKLYQSHIAGDKLGQWSPYILLKELMLLLLKLNAVCVFCVTH